MITSTWRGEYSLSITLESLLINAEKISAIEIHQKEGAHDFALLHVAALSPEALTRCQGMGIRLHWGRKVGVKGEFCGQISSGKAAFDTQRTMSSTLTQERTDFSNTVICALGASAQMQHGSLRTWSNRTITSVVREIAEERRLSYEIDNHDLVWPRITQVGESDWEFMLGLAQRLGYSLTVHGTHLRFIDPVRALGRTDRTFIGTIRPPHLYHLPNRIGVTSFVPSVGLYTASGFSGEYKATGLDEGGNAFILSSQPGRPTTGMGRQPYTDKSLLVSVASARSYEQAETMLQAKVRENLWANTAEMRGTGQATLTPGSVVRITGFRSAYDGPWYVREVKHYLTSKIYTVTASLGRDGFGRSESPPLPAPAIDRARVDSLYVNRQWVSAGRSGNA